MATWLVLILSALLGGTPSEAVPATSADEFQSPISPVRPTPPYPPRSTSSPNSRYIVREFVSADSEEGWDYRLALYDRSSKRHVRFYTHHRFAVLRWSPDSRRVTLSDFMGSDTADCYVIRLPAVAFSSPDDRIARIMGIQRLVGGEVLHLYFDCERWVSPRSIIIHVWGDGTAPGATGPLNGVDAIVLYSLSGKIKVLSVKRD